MAGLMSGAPETGAQPPAHGPTDTETPNVSPEEQKAYNQFVANGHIAIYSEQTFQNVLQSLKSERPAESLASTAATIVKQLSDSARKNGREISGDVLLHGGKEIFEELADLQVLAGIADLPQDQLEGAWYRAMDLYRSMAEGDGSLDKEAIGQDMATLVQADQQGRLDEVLPGVTQAAAQQGAS